jgi:formylglycine-generating enzyme required for sulfatase activity
MSPVGSYPKGASPYGALDMVGNVWEWVMDRYSATYYNVSLSENPAGPLNGSGRVMRGGSWNNTNMYARVSNRGNESPSKWSKTFGFRCVYVP